MNTLVVRHIIQNLLEIIVHSTPLFKPATNKYYTY